MRTNQISIQIQKNKIELCQQANAPVVSLPLPAVGDQDFESQRRNLGSVHDYRDSDPLKTSLSV